MRALLLLPLFAARLLLAQAPAAPPTTTGFLAQSIALAGAEHRYVLWLPHDHHEGREWPLIVFLNGAGECGTDGWKQAKAGLGPALAADGASWPFVVLFPQKPDRASAWEDHDAMVMAMVEKTRKDHRIDGKRLFLTGLSQGGHGTWVLGARHAGLWTAIAPICGYGDPAAIAPALQAMPIWCFHGEDDKAVPVQQSKALCAAVAAAGGSAALTLYPKVGHNSWDKAYREEPLAAWLLTTALDRTAARYTAEPDAITSARIEVRHVATADAGPAFRTDTTAVLSLDRTGLAFRVARSIGDAAPATRSGKVEGSDGRRFLVEQVRALARGAVFLLPANVPAAPAGAALGSSPDHIDLACEGRHGPWQFRRELRAAAADPQAAIPRQCLDAFLRAIDGLR